MRYVEYLWALRKGKVYFIRKGKFTEHTTWFDSMGWPNSEYDRIVKGSIEVDNQDKQIHTYYHGGGRSEVTPNEVVSNFVRKYGKSGYSVIGNPMLSNPVKENFGVLWAIVKGRVHIGPKLTESQVDEWTRNLKYGHIRWFERMGWPTSGEEFDKITRGIIEVYNKQIIPQSYYGASERKRPIPNEVFNAFFRKYPAYKKYYIRELFELGSNPVMRKDPMAHPKPNPITSAEQYGLMAAIASGATLRQDVGISQELAREMIRKTPRRLRSKFAAELAKKRKHNNPQYKGVEYDIGPAVYGWRIAIFFPDGAVYDKTPNTSLKEAREKARRMIDRKYGHNPIMNPSAEELTETWHGRPPEEVIDYEEIETHESDAAVLAELEELAIILDNHEDTISIEFGEDPPMLVANVATDTLEVLGGDQHLEFGEGWDTSKSEISIGHVYLIAYCTDKHHLEGSNGRPESYEHFFGEEYYKGRGYKVSDYKDTAKATASEQFFDDVLENGVVEDAIVAGYLPVMIYDTVNEKVKLVGGRYTIEDVGLRD